MKKNLYFLSAAFCVLALAACQQENQEEPLPASSIYLTSGVTPANEVNFVVNYDALTDNETLVGNSEISLKLCSVEAVAENITAELVVASGSTLAAEAYEITNGTATIEAGNTEGSAAFTLSLKPEAIAEGSYVLSLSINIVEGNAELSSNSVVNVKVARNRLNSDLVPAGWKRLTNSDFSYCYPWECYEDEGFEIANAFDGDINTEWCGYTIYGDYYSSYDGYCYGCYMEVDFNEPVELAGLILAHSLTSQYYYCRARRLTVFVKYEGAEDYSWDKEWEDGYDEDWNLTYNVGDEGYYKFSPVPEQLGDYKWDIAVIPGYQASASDYTIDECNYEYATVSLEEKVAGKKIVSLLVAPARLTCYQDGWCEDTADYYYTYYYDTWYGTVIGDLYLFAK